MLTIGDIIQDLDSKGRKPGSPNYATAVKETIMFHYEIEKKEDLSDEKKLIGQSKNIAQTCQKLYLKASQNVNKIFTVDNNKVRQLILLL